MAIFILYNIPLIIIRYTVWEGRKEGGREREGGREGGREREREREGKRVNLTCN